MTEIDKIQVKRLINEVIDDNKRLEIYTIRDISEILKIPEYTVRECIHTRGLPMSKGAGCYRISRQKFEAWCREKGIM